MEDDWDLQAVVRGCTASAASSAAAATTSFAVDLKPRSFCFPSCGIKQDVEDEKFVCFPDPFERRNAIEELHELYKPFFPKSQQPLSPPINIPIPNFSALGGFKNQSQQQQQQQQQPQQQIQQQSKQFLAGSVTTTNTTTTTAITSTHSQTTRSKRRKNQLKKVCQVPAEGLSSDIWSWRKYGQKPIKGSPYPRGYYRCSSSKGCLARKQVERNRSDPTMFIVTYTAEHNHPVPTHRNSLAGTTRHHHKPPSSSSPMANESNNNPITKPSSCSNSTATISTNSIEDEVEQRAKLENRVDIEQEEEEEEEEIMVEDGDEDEMGFSDTAVTDDFFEGLDEIKGAVTGDCFSDPFPASFSLSWMSKNAAATTAGGS